ncbi:3'-5' exoribonuclease YhaM family protein [Fimbriiglobus ruber]|uniref:3'->5' exoribonuclease Bsu YhaM n=1 Tax=Fimbriiglobus ruber TaxID=1908690 RepID=A0A225DQV2_9BACT|nr:HD domain-containing protein [Fimbriiglobus ruber]OWK43473.1 3'->5' exoribonuclease Bsu YhaM [Fimbriiglobus ruber]
MSRPKPKPAVVPFHQLQPGQIADSFALLAEKKRGTTRDGKPFFTCRFRDAKRTAECKVWADSPMFANCESDWQAGTIYKLRGVFTDHEKYGPQVDVQQLRPVNDEDKADGLRESDFFDRSRFDSDEMFAALRSLAEQEVRDVPLRQLVVGLLDQHAAVLKVLPATHRRFHAFPGGWLEHTLSVTRSCVWLAEKYAAHYPELTPPLNRDLIVAGAVLHDIGRVAELAPGVPGQPVERTIPGQLFGHILLGRDMIREAARAVPELNPELLTLLEHIVVTHLTLPEWGSPRLPAIPEVLVLHHADDLDAKMELYARCLTRDATDGPFTEFDPTLKKPLLKHRGV